MSKTFHICPKCFTKKLYRTAGASYHPPGFMCAAKGCSFIHAVKSEDDDLAYLTATPPAPTEKALVAEVAKCEKKISHWKQWRNEPSAKRKLSVWRRRLKRAKTVAASFSIKLPEPPPPPPPPPTEGELAAIALKETQQRVLLPWYPQPKTTAWAPWGTSGWSAVVVTTVNHKWVRVRRVNPKTEERVAKGKARKNRLVRRDPELKGKDKPAQSPLEVFPDLDEAQAGQDDSDTMTALPVSRRDRPKPVLTPEEQAQKAARVEQLIGLLDDDSADDDW